MWFEKLKNIRKYMANVVVEALCTMPLHGAGSGTGLGTAFGTG